ncbi:MAG: hypothetical protein AAFX94_02550, partial [Myxococcota bacterium]
ETIATLDHIDEPVGEDMVLDASEATGTVRLLATLSADRRRKRRRSRARRSSMALGSVPFPSDQARQCIAAAFAVCLGA